MILSSYLQELSVKANKRRNNQRELLNLVPNIDFYSTSKNRFVEKKELPKKEIRMKKNKGLMEIIDKEEPVKKEEEQSDVNDITEGTLEEENVKEENVKEENVKEEEEQSAVNDITEGTLEEENVKEEGQSAGNDINEGRLKDGQSAGSDINDGRLKEEQIAGSYIKKIRRTTLFN